MTTISVKTASLRDGPVLPYAEAGYGGTPVVFVHAIADSWWSFEPMLRRLPVSLHGYAPTQRGHGDAERRPDEGYRPEDFAADLVGFLDAVGIERAVLVGASSGGVAARMVAGSHPDRILGLVLLGAPATLADKPAVARVWEEIQGLADPVSREFVDGFMGGLTARPIARGLLETMTEENLKVPAHVWKETMRGLMEADLPATLAGILVPTLVVWGDQDDFLPRADQQAVLDAVHGSRLLVYEGVGHAVHWEQPDRVVADVAEFAGSVLR
ncbi:alpha/beta hydrolase [Streptomyces sp. NPDC051907]|uniref:alpha/beta fold hydrolase n=1 Tax=Streptomyces sp. NPDC051907 TaxID=3155284 RepID=UPI00342BCADB